MANLDRPLPWYCWYVVDYRASRRVQRLDYIAKGLYRELLDECWLVGAIPDDIEKLADICSCPVGVMAESWARIRPLFEPTHGMDGMYLVSPRQEKERSEQDKIRIARALAGKKGGESRWQVLGKSKQVSISSSSSSSRAEQSSSSSKPEQMPAAVTGGICSECNGRKGIHRPDCSLYIAPSADAGALPLSPETRPDAPE